MHPVEHSVGLGHGIWLGGQHVLFAAGKPCPPRMPRKGRVGIGTKGPLHPSLRPWTLSAGPRGQSGRSATRALHEARPANQQRPIRHAEVT
jgi:hypothetical protein